jgi:hypothetical protein
MTDSSQKRPECGRFPGRARWSRTAETGRAVTSEQMAPVSKWSRIGLCLTTRREFEPKTAEFGGLGTGLEVVSSTSLGLSCELLVSVSVPKY